jgi:DNA-binding protein H-NS
MRHLGVQSKRFSKHPKKNWQGKLMATLEQMEAQMAALQTKIEAEKARMQAEAIEKITAIMAEHGLTASDITQAGNKRRTDKVKKPVQAMYQDPKSGATWSGRGRAPGWIAGKKREKFLIAR